MNNEVDLSEVLSSNYLLAELSVRTWGATKTDREASEDLSNQQGAAADAARVVKKLLAGNDASLKEVLGEFNAIRGWFYAQTLPWTASTEGNRRGKRLVAALDATEFLTEFAKRKKAAEAKLGVFLQEYDALVAAASTQLGGLFKSDDYPTRQAVATAFGAAMRLDPVPAKADFTRVPLPGAITVGLQKLYEQQAQTQVENAMADFHGRLCDELSRLSTQLMKVVRGEKAKLYKTLLSNLQQLVRLARSLVPLDPALGDVASRIENELLQHDIDAFKDNVSLSAAIAKRADTLRHELTGDTQPEPAQQPSTPAEPETASTQELLQNIDEFDVDSLIMQA